jgi:phospholipid/cholesterol/gamma-HCH transport system substrate-binding protein
VFQSLTGTGSVSLTGGKADSPPLLKTPGEEYPVIASQPSLTSRLNSAAPQLLTNLTQTIDSINALLNEKNRAELTSTLHNIAILTERLAQQSDQLNTAFEQVEAILKNARTASDSLPAMFEDLSASAKGLTQMSEQVRMVGKSAAAVIDGFEHVIATGEEGLTYFTSTTLPDINAMIAELRVASENLRRASEKLERNPSVLIYGETTLKPGPGE